MFPLLPVIAATIYSLQVKCGHCKKNQVVPADAKTESVRCKFCHTSISLRSCPGDFEDYDTPDSAA